MKDNSQIAKRETRQWLASLENTLGGGQQHRAVLEEQPVKTMMGCVGCVVRVQ